MTKDQSGARETPHENVTEGGKAPAPKEPNGQMKPSASSSAASGADTEGTSKATTGKAEKQHAEDVSKGKPT